MDDQDIRRNWIATASEERTRLHTVLHDAREAGEQGEISAAKAAADSAQDSHMRAIEVMFPEQFVLAREAGQAKAATPPPMIACATIGVGRALDEIWREFDKRFKLRLVEMGSLASAPGHVVDSLIDEVPNPWRAMMVRSILLEIVQNYESKPEKTKHQQVCDRSRLFIPYMTSRQLYASNVGVRFHAGNAMKSFIAAVGEAGLKDLFKQNSPTAESHHDTLVQDWAKWQNYAPLDSYQGEIDERPRIGAPRKPRPNIAAELPSRLPLPWWDQLSFDGIAATAERRAIRIVRSVVRQIQKRPAYENWHWGRIHRSASGGWNVDSRMSGCLVAVEGIRKHAGFQVPAIQTTTFTLELPAGAIGLLLAPSEQWATLIDAGLIAPITDRETKRAISQISLGNSF